MGNCFRRCSGNDSDFEYDSRYGGHDGASRPDSVTSTVVGFTAVPRDLREFETTNKLPAILGYYVSASKAMQSIWFEKLLAAWKRANPAPETPEAVAVLIVQTLEGHYDIEGLLSFYHLSRPAAVPASQPVPVVIEAEEPGRAWPAGVQFEIYTLPVNENTVGDGDGFTVLVDVNKDAREMENLPTEIEDAVERRRNAQAQKNFEVANALQKQIEARNYKVFDGKNGRPPCLAHKYKIRLRGVDAPEVGPGIGQPYAEEAKVVLRDLLKDQQLLIHVYGTDKYGRIIGDVYVLSNGIFIQEVLLKKGLVWYFEFHDKRQSFAEWERDAKNAGLGLWADANPEEPRDYRKKNRINKSKKKGNRSFKKRGG